MWMARGMATFEGCCVHAYHIDYLSDWAGLCFCTQDGLWLNHTGNGPVGLGKL